jgi:hypothetical protein
MVGVKIRGEPLSLLNKLPQLLRLLIYVNRNAALWRKGMEICHVFANSRWAILPPLLLADSGFLGISQRLSCTLYELPRGFPIAFGHFPAAILYPLAVPSGYPTAF